MSKILKCPNCDTFFEDDFWHTAKEQLRMHLQIEEIYEEYDIPKVISFLIEELE